MESYSNPALHALLVPNPQDVDVFPVHRRASKGENSGIKTQKATAFIVVTALF